MAAYAAGMSWHPGGFVNVLGQPRSYWLKSCKYRCAEEHDQFTLHIKFCLIAQKIFPVPSALSSTLIFEARTGGD
jgi:hypothetical protein